jgi:nucleotide-binding universal stress UspA family protein
MVYRNILVAIDGSDQSRAALDHAAELARDQNARLTLITVVAPVPAGAAVGSAQVAPLREENYHEVLDEAVAVVPQDVGVVKILAHGKPASEIAERVEGGDFDLVVMGAHGRGRVGDAVIGSVSREVLHRVHTPVLLIRG